MRRSPFRFLAVTALLSLLTGCSASGPIAINEFVASNVSGITDPSGGDPDWIELVNLTSDTVSLDGWFISDDSTNPMRHALDGLEVPGDGYLLLFASGDTTLGEDHLSFRLNLAGEEVVLSEGDKVVDSLSFGAQESDVAFARIPDGTGSWTAAEPTPGEPNE